MRTQDRASAAAKKSIAAGPVMGDRLPAPPRERKPALAALAALLVLAGALGATMLVMQAGDRIEAVRITERVPMGGTIPESAMTSVLVADDSSVNYVRWEQRGQLKEELRAATDLVGGTILIGEMLTGEETLPEDEVIVGVSLQPGQFPAGLKAGDTVAAYWVGRERNSGDEESPAQQTVITEEAHVSVVHGSGDSIGNTSLPVTLRVAREDAAALTRAASAGEVSLVIIAASN
ncbi:MULTISPECIES: hypothetical protein [unclassified Streptomyces]|uniref:hypothetical protein n=1 Tax=unclassified Streptomyces TaxID=2593676 RepID=UPI001F2846EA|nr:MULTISPECIES: hypothetical protein [unclassified Streptomyces]MCU4745718.1 hypothetical protein [Streptomyces sp. G-5]